MTNKELASLLEEKGHSIDTYDNINKAILDSKEFLLNYESKLLLDHQEVRAFYINISDDLDYLYESGFINKHEVRLLKVLVRIGNNASKKIIYYKLEQLKNKFSDYSDSFLQELLNTIDAIYRNLSLIDLKCGEFFEHLGMLDKEGQYKRKLMKIKRKRDRKE